MIYFDSILVTIVMPSGNVEDLLMMTLQGYLYSSYLIAISGMCFYVTRTYGLYHLAKGEIHNFALMFSI